MTRAQNRSRWIAPSFAVAVIGLSACGSPMSTSSGAQSDDTSPTAVAPQVIHVSGGPVAPQAAGMAADAESSTKMAAWGGVTYVYDGTPPDLTAPAGSWFFPPNEDPTEESIAALAQSLGVEGEVTEMPADQGGGWFVGPNDYSGPTLSVGSDALHSWYYNAPSSPDASVGSGSCAMPATTTPAEGEAVAEPQVDQPSVEPANCEYVEPQPPTGILTADEAEAKATALFDSLGIDPSSYELEPYADDWSASVNGNLLLDGIRTNVAISVGYGAEGALTWASGYLGTPQRSADYDRIGVPAAIERLNEQYSTWMGYGGVFMDSARSGVAVGAATPAAAPTGEPVSEPAVEPAVSEPAVEGSVTETIPAPAPDTVEPSIAIDPPMCAADAGADCGTIAPPEPITVTLQNARASLEQVWADDGTVWLLPGYTFDSTDGGIYSVLAVPDQYIEVSEPVAEPTTTAVDAPTDVTLAPVQPDTPVKEPEFVPPPNYTEGETGSGEPAATSTP